MGGGGGGAMHAIPAYTYTDGWMLLHTATATTTSSIAQSQVGCVCVWGGGAYARATTSL